MTRSPISSNVVRFAMATHGSELADYVREQLVALRGLSHGRFFSGTGFSLDGVQFGMIIQGTLYFVVDDATRPEYVARGSQCFSYSTRKRRVEVKRYYSVPAELIEDQEQLVGLARESIRIASLGKPPRSSARSTRVAKKSSQKQPKQKK